MSSLKMSFRAALVASVLTAGSVFAAPIRVAVESKSGNQSSAAALAAQLNDDTFFDFSASVVDAAGLDTALELSNYDVVVLGESGHSDHDWNAALAAALKAQVNQGKLGVITTSWFDYMINGSNQPMDGDFDAVAPIDLEPGNQHYCSGPITVTPSSSTHPVTLGVTSFVTSSTYAEVSGVAPDATGGAVLATASGGCTSPIRNIVTVGTFGTGRIVHLGLLYLGNQVTYTNADLRSGMADRLLEQAASWAGRTNQPPAANAQSVTVPEDSFVPITLTGSDPEGAMLSFAITVLPNQGTLSGTPPALTYTPSPNYFGSDSFKFTVNDGVTTSAPATVTITVTNVNDAPALQPQTLSLAEDSSAPFTLVATDPDGDSLTVSIVAPPSSGAISGSHPSFTYTPSANFAGSDAVTFQVSDGQLTSNATVSFTVTPVNDAPVANPATVNLDEDTPAPFTLAGVDVDGDPLTFTVVSGVAHGTLSGSAPNLLYTPAANYFGNDSLSFTVSDGVATSAPATVSFSVVAVNDAPVAASQMVTVAEDGSVVITLSGVDVDGDPLAFTIAGAPQHGSISAMLPSVSYSPDSDFNGLDAFTFEVSDGALTSAPETVSITVTPVNDPPVATPFSVTLDQGAGVPVVLQGQDVDGDPLTWSISTLPAHGTLSGAAPNLTFTPATAYRGPDSFAYIVSDGTASSAPATVDVEIKNLAPVLSIGAETLTPVAGQPVKFTSMVVDPGGDPVTVSWDFGDGETSTDAAPSHAFAMPGLFTVTATATDGELTATQTLAVQVMNGAPVIAGIAGPEAGDEGATLSFSVTVADGTEPFTYQWLFDDGSPAGEGASVSHAWLDNGTFALTVVVTDSTGAEATSTRTITINNLPPAPSPIADQTATVGVPFGLQLGASDAAGERDTLGWALVSGPGALSPTGQFTWTPTEAETGRFTVVARVSDDDGAHTDLPFAIEVAEGESIDPGGCGCAATSSGASLLWAAAALAAALGRRRRRS